MVVDMILSQYLIFLMKFGHFIVQNFFREQAFSDRWTRSSTIWTDHPQPGLTVYIRDQLSTSGTNCLYRDQPSTYEGPQPVATGTNHLNTKVHDRLYTKVCNRLHTKVTTGYKRRSQPVTYKGLQLITYGKLQLVLYEKVTFCFSKKWTCLFQIGLTTRILRILPIFY